MPKKVTGVPAAASKPSPAAPTLAAPATIPGTPTIKPRRAISFPLSLCLAIAGGLATGSSARGQIMPGSSPQKTANQLVQVKVVPDVKRVTPGERFHLAVDFRIDPGWHLYWKNPGAGAAPIDLTVTVPPGFRALPPRWPRPSVIGSPIGDMYCYSDRATLFVPVTAPMVLADGRASFSVDAAWAVCDDKVCLLGDRLELLTVPTRGQPASPQPSDDPIVTAGRPRLPEPLGEVEDAVIALDDEHLEVTGPARGFGVATFFPIEVPGVTYGTPEVEIADDRFRVRIKVEVNSRNLRGESPRIGGLVALGSGPDDPSYEFERSLVELQDPS